MAEGEEKKGFRRLNFFRGQRADWSDWSDEIRYRVEKHRFHNRLMHSPGIVDDLESGLSVTSRGDMTVEVKPGFALDGEGHEISSPEIHIKAISTNAFKLKEEYVYVVVRYVEEPTDFIAYKQNLSVKGHRRILETSEVAITVTEPKIESEVELARILVDRDAKIISAAKDPHHPGVNEIDRRFVRWAGVAGGRISGRTREALGAALHAVKRAMLKLGGIRHHSARKYVVTHSAIAAANTIAMLSGATLIDMRNYYEIVGLCIELVGEVYGEIKMYDPEALKRPEFVEFATQMRHVHTMWNERKPNNEAMQILAKAFQNAADHISRLFPDPPPR